MNPSKANRLGLASQYAIAAARMAIEDSRLDLCCADLNGIGVGIGTTMGEIRILENINDAIFKPVPEINKSQFLFSQYPCESIPANVADAFELSGPNTVIPTACAAGNYAISWAFDQIQEGRACAMLAGGVDTFSRVAFTGFNRLLSAAPDKCRPFDKNRNGIMVSEGAGMLVLESHSSAKARGAGIYAEILGCGFSCDAHHMTSPDPEGIGISRAIDDALYRANVASEEIDYICAHGTGTVANDRAEATAIKRVFGKRASTIPVSSIKSMIGHTMGAASAIEAIATVLILKNGIIPPTINYENPDPDCNLDCVPDIARKQKMRTAISNAFAFGGNNSCLAVKKW